MQDTHWTFTFLAISFYSFYSGMTITWGMYKQISNIINDNSAKTANAIHSESDWNPSITKGNYRKIYFIAVLRPTGNKSFGTCERSLMNGDSTSLIIQHQHMQIQVCNIYSLHFTNKMITGILEFTSEAKNIYIANEEQTYPNFQDICIFSQQSGTNDTPLVFSFLEMRVGKQEKHLSQLK